MKNYIDQITKRKSTRKYDTPLTQEELEQVRYELTQLTPLVPDIKVHYEIIKREETSAKFGEYCLLIYSEKKPHYLVNAGYLLEQLDLYLTSVGLGSCWYGQGKAVESFDQKDSLEYVIMLTLGKNSIKLVRNDSSEFKRKPSSEIWQGNFDQEVIDLVRLAPSAVNSQPWRFKSNKEEIQVFRTSNLITLIPATKLTYFNAVDMGIGLCFLEQSLTNKGIKFERILLQEEKPRLGMIPIATYKLLK